MLEIAQRYYGTVRALPKLMALNEDQIEDPDRVRVGQKIRVPAEPRR
jgi:nucleoid-associated protein YgaU